MDETEAAALLASMQGKSGKLSDEELDAVAGGAQYGKFRCSKCRAERLGCDNIPCSFCGSTSWIMIRGK